MVKIQKTIDYCVENYAEFTQSNYYAKYSICYGKYSWRKIVDEFVK